MIFEKLKGISDSNFTNLLTNFQKIMKKTSYAQKDILQKEGTICNHLFLIEKGIARVFYYKDGKDITAHFALENETTTAIDSFIQRKKAYIILSL